MDLTPRKLTPWLSSMYIFLCKSYPILKTEKNNNSTNERLADIQNGKGTYSPFQIPMVLSQNISDQKESFVLDQKSYKSEYFTINHD